jgi:hypothetical protein
MPTILQIIADKKDVLPRAFRYVVEHNPSNDAPYHNLDHMLRVAHRCYEGCSFHALTAQQRTETVLAALFHDFDHSQGRLSDEWNVKAAIRGLMGWYNSNPMNQANINIDRVAKIIEATEYPYVIPTEDLTLQQAIIRDADLMMSLDINWMGTVIVGLGKEMGYDIRAMANGQYEFLSKVQMNSEWGRNVYKEEWSRIFENLTTLRSLL